MTFALSEKLGAQIRYVRIALDALCVLSGFLLGGSVGLCTVATIFLSGYMLQFFLSVLKKYDIMQIGAKKSR